MGIPVNEISKKIEIEDNMIIYEDFQTNVKVAIETFDGAIRENIIIEDSSASETFDFKMNLPKDYRMQFAQDIYDGNKQDGSIEIVDKNGQVVGAISVPWAYDINGKSVETYFEINEDVLTQVVKHRSKDDIIYPLVADPSYQFSHWFKDSSGWITRNNVVSLKLVPTNSLRISGVVNTIKGSTAELNASWTAAKNKYSSSKKWRNTKSMYQQYACHYIFVIWKSSYNLEPHRKAVLDNKELIRKLCNP